MVPSAWVSWGKLVWEGWWLQAFGMLRSARNIWGLVSCPGVFFWFGFILGVSGFDFPWHMKCGCLAQP